MVWGIIGLIVGYFIRAYTHEKDFRDRFWQLFKKWLRSLKDKENLP
jgi:hypothetical protein